MFYFWSTPLPTLRKLIDMKLLYSYLVVISALSKASLWEIRLNSSSWIYYVLFFSFFFFLRWWISRPERHVSVGQLQWGKRPIRRKSKKRQRRNLRIPVSAMRFLSHITAKTANTALPTGNTAKSIHLAGCRIRVVTYPKLIWTWMTQMK